MNHRRIDSTHGRAIVPGHELASVTDLARHHLAPMETCAQVARLTKGPSRLTSTRPHE